VIYLYLDRLNNAFSNWGRSSKVDKTKTEPNSVKQAAE
jgi:HAE1 family hydrophobic/amphiphilic exporter-1